MSIPEDAVLNDPPDEAPLATEPFPVEPEPDPGEYLDTQTLDGADGYFHTEDDAEHQAQQSPETDLVIASQGQTSILDPNADGLDGLTRQELMDLADSRGVTYPPRPTKAQLLEALRA